MNDEIDAPFEIPPLHGPGVDDEMSGMDSIQLLMKMHKEVVLENERAAIVQQELFERQMNFINKWRQDRGLGVENPT